MTDRDDSTDEAAAWLAKHKDLLADVPTEIRLRRGGRDVDQLPAADVLPPAARPNKSDIPLDFDPELGLITEGSGPTPETSEEAARRWSRLAGEIIRQIGSTTIYGPHLPVARLPELDAPPYVSAMLLDALPELEALHRKLCPGWREIVHGWLNQRAKARTEARYRHAWEHEAASGERANLLPPRTILSGARLLETIRSNPRELMGDVPEGLSSEILDYLGGVVTRTGRGAGGLTPESAMAKLEEWIMSPDAFRDALEDVVRRDAKRKSRRRQK